MSEYRVHPETLAGDPFPAAKLGEEHPCICNDGWVTIGQLVAAPETGEEVEEYALYLCRLCQEG